ncbi:MAG: DEAD/DEAH box helicase [Deltaproteobacteria bacterium CG_4_9_14_3_um_filter_44_9]|nr:MAG: DEAD/DEAH box helicase [Deltaproteobacteria bacterium CG2_30_43_15]PIU86655.1 MAG: DEAD/DEAH box helicase [Deltaproteobacteria bacterium CG06_land_8_20_14_3_00_44_19]PIX22752.1 MAG: DEAD/DEAH box helicase [Deltaproteobacteria bacterium CG_4_8_14_3_um_filter_43_13]PJB46613.1 MAG: DEAD/DEAH box helicase [Deltaproteobacteria bacterium CG_4_9_14_3_um_filter_44_9]HCX89086.1 DEAD/DEAH box helicase [Deltaproteobacteria bacterium]
MANITENTLEQTALAWFESLGYAIESGPEIAFDGARPERKADAFYADVVLEGRLRMALQDINSSIPPDAIEDAVRKILLTESPSLIENNRRFHRLLTDGVDVSYMVGGREVFDKVWLLDLKNLENNDWLVVNQFTVIENQKNRRPDLLVFINGLPLAVIELKNPADEKTTIRQAFNQLQTYKQDIPCLFTYNELLIISDGLEARAGTLTSGWDRFMPWRTVEGTEVAPKGSVELEVLIKGVFDRRRFLDMILNFIVFEDDGGEVVKKAAAYHQYHAVNKAVECTLSACGIKAEPGQLYAQFPSLDELNPFEIREPSFPYGERANHFGGRRIGVIWHTQGSGKSLSMAFFAGKIIRHPAMANPTLVVITDRNDLDEQLFGTFSRCKDLMRQTPVQAETREHLRELLHVPAGGVVFTTIQKFMSDEKGDQYPQLSDRENIVVIADEAHRSQYDFIDGYARHMHDALPKASFIGFTATPIERDDRSTPAVFGDYIDKYDILRAIEDKATVAIYYEGRLAKIELNEDERPKIDHEFEEITEGEEESGKQQLRRKWAALEAMVGTKKRIALVAEDLVRHVGQRQDAMKGKALIVCMSRRICVDMYNAVIKLRPQWHSDDDDKGMIKIVMSGAVSDRLEWQRHIRNKARRESLAKRFKNPDDSLAMVLVRDMWLTGFDCPPMHTMYVDKPMRSHGLMQAIARVNRVFKDKPGGLVVDYIGLAYQLKRALADYTEAGGRGDATLDQEEAVAVMRERYDIVASMYHGFDYASLIHAEPAGRIAGIASAMEHILQLEDGKKRYLESVTVLSKAFALAVPHEEALNIRDEVGFFQVVRSALAKATVEGEGKSPEEMDTAIQQLVSRAVISDEVVDIFASVGLKKPDISILSDEFLKEVQQLPHKNLAVEVLRKLLNNEIKARSRKNVVQARSFAEMLEEAIRKYQNRAIEAAQVIEELIALAKDMRDAQKRGEKLGLNEDELAFYDALEVNDSAVKVLGDEILKTIAHELVTAVRRNVSVDWTVRENARAYIRVVVRRILRKYGYPPDKQEKATQTVLEQAEVLCKDFIEKEEMA